MKSVFAMPMVTVEQCERYRTAALQIERQRDMLLLALKLAVNGRHLSEAHNLIAEIEASK
jgi:hypothetical protein